MRIGCLQFAPQVGDTENNLNRADSVLSKANPEDLDLLVLPELAFSGTLPAGGTGSQWGADPSRQLRQAILDCWALTTFRLQF